MEAKDQIISALDLASPSVALDFAALMAPHVGGFKVGFQLFTAGGPELVRQLVRMCPLVFLDLKYHDIPNTVAGSSVEATRLGVRMFNVHCLGGLAMMQAAAEAVSKETATSESRPLVLGVTVLTSLDYAALSDMLPINVDAPAEEQDRFVRTLVTNLALLTKKAGLDGVVASPLEAAMIRAACGSGFTIVTPGINLGGGPVADQKRTGTAGQAIRDGADYVVVGRAFLQAKEPIRVAQAMADEITKDDMEGAEAKK